MSVYYPFSGVTKVQTGPSSPPNQIILPAGSDNPNNPPLAQAFTLVVNGIGNCSATCQIVGSNDGVNFINYGAAITASSAFADITPGIASANGTITYKYYGAYITAISGTNAAATLAMSA